jgi:hypothetical protein
MVVYGLRDFGADGECTMVRQEFGAQSKCGERIEEQLEAPPVAGFRAISEVGIGHQTKVIA